AQVLAVEPRQLKLRRRPALPAAELALNDLAELRIRLNRVHVYARNLMCGGIALDKMRHARIGFHPADQDIGRIPRVEVELFGDNFQERRMPEALLKVR